MSQLIVLSEDVKGIQKYLAQNNLYPTKLFFVVQDMMEQMTFPDPDILYLIIVHGMHRFKTAELQPLFDACRLASEAGSTVVIMSDVVFRTPDFHKSRIQFVEYSGDLFYGRYAWYVNNREKRNSDKEDAVVNEILEGKIKAEKAKNTTWRADFWKQFGEFTEPCEVMVGELPEPYYQDELPSVDFYRKKLVSSSPIGD